MIASRLDHLVVAAPSLALGSAFVRERLGVTCEAGGAHERMGTHNLLLRLGDAVYLEVIAIDPDAPKPHQARWFGLDNPMAVMQPRLATWVARTHDVRSTAAASRVALGDVAQMSRGSLHWLMTIPANGNLTEGGIVPSVIQWLSERRPCDLLRDQGCRLVGLELVHPRPDVIADALDGLAVDRQGQIRIVLGETPRLVALVRTAAGICRL